MKERGAVCVSGMVLRTRSGERPERHRITLMVGLSELHLILPEGFG